MAKIQCEVCGGSSLIKKEDRFVCEDCGISYSLEAVQRMLRAGISRSRLADWRNTTHWLRSIYGMSRP